MLVGCSRTSQGTSVGLPGARAVSGASLTLATDSPRQVQKRRPPILAGMAVIEMAGTIVRQFTGSNIPGAQARCVRLLFSPRPRPPPAARTPSAESLPRPLAGGGARTAPPASATVILRFVPAGFWSRITRAPGSDPGRPAGPGGRHCHGDRPRNVLTPRRALHADRARHASVHE
jgi:hypothetical protein